MKKAVIIGMGKSGKAAAHFLEARGIVTAGVDSNAASGFPAKLSFEGAELIVISPGVPPTDSNYIQAKTLGIPIIGEAELGLRELHQPCIGITGSNGKTTVTMLVEHVLLKSGKKARAIGNVGTPFTEYALHPDPEEIIVAELSSYQLETLHAKVFDAGIVLNITPNHLDRYTSMEEYARAKMRLQECMKDNAALFIYQNVADDFGFLLHNSFATFGAKGSDFSTDKITVQEGETIAYFLPIRYRSWGIHESENALAAWLLCRHFGVSTEDFLHALESFQKPAHRIEFVTEIDKVSFYDDSKGTSVDATMKAVASMIGEVILIVGGMDKGGSYAPWKEFQGKVRRVIALGLAAKKIAEELSGTLTVDIATSLEEAVDWAAKSAKEGDSVLLSPGCSSLDMFRDYAHRGDEFKRFVYNLRERRKTT
ncbi:MAG: UDP-N-acetylmuramoyl-L-alanine--D-glutamate ligase [Verrucomicrobia bacterium]|nr:UDP-N-acetylmuramoyl-L-alanine--D-glutamate ligase [Verrucomicrobiota bacterium]